MTMMSASPSCSSCSLPRKQQDLVWLLTLKAASEQPSVRGEALAHEICQALPQCHSPRKLLADCIEEMLQTGCVSGTPCSGLTITDYGRCIHQHLLSFS